MRTRIVTVLALASLTVGGTSAIVMAGGGGPPGNPGGSASQAQYKPCLRGLKIAIIVAPAAAAGAGGAVAGNGGGPRRGERLPLAAVPAPRV